ncbi:MAG: polymorphic toxin type 23 domain-containing protein [Crocinitomicaceae bacterium]|nr:polymorphic toxin type 23 domain-containing protein [Crocinitomicaceae bacterium]
MRSILLVFLFIGSFSNAQNYFSEHFGGSIGLVVNLGTHSDAVGINLKAYYTDYFFQVNAGSAFYFHPKSYGGRKNFWESRTAIGAVLLAGKKEQRPNQMLDGLNHQTAYNYGIGYNYIWYFDNARTSQNSGGWGFHVKSFSLYHENDFFAGTGEDRFRTGHAYANYRYKDWQFGLGLNIWTGDSRHAPWQKISMDKCPNGFCILEDQPYGKTSHGFVYGSATYHMPFRQAVTMRVGVDSERARHFMQNRMFHDLIFLPKSIERSTPHYPMLDNGGCAVFDQKKARDSEFYFQLNANDNWSN